MESYQRERITNRYRTNALFSFKLANKRQFCRWRERVFYLYTRLYTCIRIYIYKYTYRASRTGHASYTLNSVRMSPNGEIVINLSVKIQTRPGFPNNLLRTRGARDAILSLFLFRLDSRIDSRANHPSDRNLARLSIASVPGEVADENVTSNDRKTGT